MTLNKIQIMSLNNQSLNFMIKEAVTYSIKSFSFFLPFVLESLKALADVICSYPSIHSR